MNSVLVRPRIADLLSTVLGVGLIVAGVLALSDQWPVGTAFMLIVAGGAALPLVQVPGKGRFARPVIFVAAFAVAMATPLYSDFIVHRQIAGAYRAAAQAAARLTEVAKQGGWPKAAADFPDKLDVYADGYSRDIQLKGCSGMSCMLVVTLTDHDYDTSIRSRHFALWTKDGGKTWTCGPTRLYPLAPKDLPTACESTGAH